MKEDDPRECVGDWASQELWKRDAEIERLKAENEITVRVCNENTDLKLRINELEEENAHHRRPN
jgi:hypothetical protein